MNLFLVAVLLLAAPSVCGNLRGSNERRELDADNNDDYYFATTDLGRPNKRAILDNPLKGLLTSPRYTGHNTPTMPIPSTLEFYYIGFSE